jgi:O-antigen biosynthesis protein
MIDVIIPVYNNLELTQRCLASLERNPVRLREGVRLILVDNGSSEETAAVLRGAADVYLRFKENLGFVKAVNAGLALSRNDVVLMNNDVLLTRHSITTLLDKPLQVVGPLTNRVQGSHSESPQLISAGYKDPWKEVDAFAESLHQERAGGFRETEFIYFHLALIRRSVIERVGMLDERFGIGCSDDLDYCMRARREGSQVGIALDGYVHHECHATFRALGIDIDEQLRRNQLLLEKKWQGSS